MRIDVRSCILLAASVALTGCAVGPRQSQSNSSPAPALDGIPDHFSSRSDYLRAEDRLREHLLRYPNDAVAYSQLGRVYSEQGRSLAALRSYRQAVALDGNLTDARVRLAGVLEERGELDEALEHLDAALKSDRNLEKAYALKGQIHRKQGESRKARTALEAGWACRPPSVDAGWELAQWQLARAETANALDTMRLCLAYEPDRVEIRMQYARSLADAGRYRQSLAQWEQLRDEGAGGAAPYLALAELYHQLGDPDAADQHFQRSRQLRPDAPQLAHIEKTLRSPVPEPTPTEFRSLR